MSGADGRAVAAVGLAASLGALVRYYLDGWITARTGTAFPWGTLAINVSGSFVLGVLFALFSERPGPEWLRVGSTTGFLGAYTTFSTFSLDTLRLIEQRAYLLATINATGSVVLGLAAAAAGVALVRAL